MKIRLHAHSLVIVLLMGLLLSSCGNVDIVKRRYRPGFHVDVTKKRQKSNELEKEVAADKRKDVKDEAFDTAVVAKETEEITNSSVVSSNAAATLNLSTTARLEKSSSPRSLPDFSKLSFHRKLQVIKNQVFKSQPRGRAQGWMHWAAFGSGLASMIFGVVAVVFAALFASSYFVWPALIFSAAAIVFAILYKQSNGTDPKAKLGLIFGIIGGGLAVIALTIWVVLIAI